MPSKAEINKMRDEFKKTGELPDHLKKLVKGKKDFEKRFKVKDVVIPGMEWMSKLGEERDYKDEYKKFQSSTKSKKYRAELNKYNRKKGTYGNGDGKDASHKGGKIVGFESQSKNRGRAEKSRLKKEGTLNENPAVIATAARMAIQNAQGKKVSVNTARQSKYASKDPSAHKKAKSIFQRIKDKFSKKKDDKPKKKSTPTTAADFRRSRKENVNEGMSESQRFKVYNSLKRGDIVSIKYDSSIQKGSKYIPYVVTKGKTKLMKGKIERIILKSPKNPRFKAYLYNRDGDVSLALGDMAASIVDMKKGKVKESTMPNFTPIIDEAMDGLITEGARDPGIFKGIFLAGGPGSGKTFVASGLFGIPKKVNVSKTGLKMVNQDSELEYLMNKYFQTTDLDIMPDEVFQDLTGVDRAGNEVDYATSGLRRFAKDLSKARLKNYTDGRLGVIIDGTGHKYDSVKAKRKKLIDIGYDTYMVFVNTSLEVALQRNKERKRVVPEEIVKQSWNDVQKNLAFFQGLFGGANFLIVDNNKTLSEKEAQKKFKMLVEKGIDTFLKKPIKSKEGKSWLRKQKKFQKVFKDPGQSKFFENVEKPKRKTMKEHAVKFTKDDISKLHNDESVTKKDSDGKPHKYVIKEKVLKKNPGEFVDAKFSKAIDKFPNSKLTKDLVIKLAKKYKVDQDDALRFVSYGYLRDFGLKESDLGLTYKKGKTVKVKHKTSGKRLVIVDKPVVRKEYEKIGYFAESVNESKSLKSKVKYYKTISKKEWSKTSNDYKSVIDGIKYKMFLDPKKGTILAPVKVEGIGESVNEVVSADAYTISRMMGTAQQSTQDFIDDNKIDVKKLKSYIKNLSPAKMITIKDIIHGSTDNQLRNIKKGFIKQVKESVNEAIEPSGIMAKISKIVQDKQAMKISGVLMDMFSASIMMRIYNSVNDKSKEQMNKGTMRQVQVILHKVMKQNKVRR